MKRLFSLLAGCAWALSGQPSCAQPLNTLEALQAYTQILDQIKNSPDATPETIRHAAGTSFDAIVRKRPAYRMPWSPLSFPAPQTISPQEGVLNLFKPLTVYLENRNPAMLKTIQRLPVSGTVDIETLPDGKLGEVALEENHPPQMHLSPGLLILASRGVPWKWLAAVPYHETQHYLDGQADDVQDEFTMEDRALRIQAPYLDWLDARDPEFLGQALENSYLKEDKESYQFYLTMAAILYAYRTGKIPEVVGLLYGPTHGSDPAALEALLGIPVHS